MTRSPGSRYDLQIELERLDAAARDQQLVVGGTAALQPLQPVGECVEWSGQAARRRVLERADLAGGGELLQQRGHALAWERGRVGEAAREGDQVGQTEERQHGGDPLADVTPGARGDECVPPSRLGRHGHAANPRRRRSELLVPPGQRWPAARRSQR